MIIIDYIKIEEIEGIKRIESIRLDSKNTFEKQEEKGCCSNNKKKTKNKIFYDNNKGSIDSYKEEKEEKDEDIF